MDPTDVRSAKVGISTSAGRSPAGLARRAECPKFGVTTPSLKPQVPLCRRHLVPRPDNPERLAHHPMFLPRTKSSRKLLGSAVPRCHNHGQGVQLPPISPRHRRAHSMSLAPDTQPNSSPALDRQSSRHLKVASWMRPSKTGSGERKAIYFS